MIKKILSLLLLLNGSFAFAQSPCSGGMAAGTYPCNGITLQAYISASQMDADEAQDSWGWTDPLDGKEYAVVALNNGTSFVDISDPVNPRYLGRLDSHSGGASLWRDVKTYSNHAYIVSEVNDDGLQVFDLTGLRGLSTSPFGAASRNFSEDGFLFIGDSGGASNDGRAHNIVINEDAGFAYIVGVNRSSNSNDGPLFISLADPVNPAIVGEFGPSDYFHDAQVVIYDGPDTDYTGREIMIGCNENNMKILDVTNKAAPVVISTVSYSNTSYTHQGWFTEDKRFFIVGDEVDEEDFGFNTRTLVFDLTDLDNPHPQGPSTPYYTYTGATAAIDHNGYVRGNRFYLANYAAGVRIIKIDGLYDATPSMTEVSFFDTYPATNSASFNGTWNVYPFFESGNLTASGFGNELVNGDGGLFILKDPLYDNVDPTVVCQPYTATLDKNTGTVTIDASDVDGGTTDNFPIIPANLTVTGQTTFTCDDIGTHNITLTYIDDYGNTASCVAVVTVEGETTQYLGGGTWSNGAPDIGSNAKIALDYVTSAGGNGSFSACTCEVDATRTLTVSAGDHIDINGDITVNGNLIVEHTGSVVQTSDAAAVINNGTINVLQDTPNLASRDFLILGSPMTGETRTSVWNAAFIVLNATTLNFVPHPQVAIDFPGAENFADDNNNYWQFYNGALPINPGEGYLVRPQAGYGQPGGIFNYTYDDGTLNTGDVNFAVGFNTPGPTGADNKNASPNALANPYPSAISADDFINGNAMVSEVYFWEHLTPPSPLLPGAGSMNFSMEDISMYNLLGGTPAGNPPVPATTPNGIISTGQGFGIKASAGGTATFTNAMRRTSGNTTLRGSDDNGNDKDRIWLNIVNEPYEMGGSTLIGFTGNATEGMDDGYDSRRLATVLSIYSHLEDGSEQLGIQSRESFEDGMQVPLGFSTQIDATLEYKISIMNIEGENLDGAIVYLIDNLENTVTNLSEVAYAFTSEKGTFHGRFTLQFEKDVVLGPNETGLQTIILFPNPTDGVVNIHSPNAFIKGLEVFDLRGRRFSETIKDDKNGHTIHLEQLETGVYFVKITTEKGDVTKKLIKR